jgi:hypothetical protein
MASHAVALLYISNRERIIQVKVLYSPFEIGVKKATSRKPDSVSPTEALAKVGCGYHLSVPAVTCRNQAAYPAPCPGNPGLGRAVLKRYYMWHFSMQGLPANNVTIKSRRLLPYVFTLALHSLGEGG